MLQIALIKLLWQFCLVASCIILHICQGSWKRETGKRGTKLQHWKKGDWKRSYGNVGPNRMGGKRGTKFHRCGKCRTALYGTRHHFLGNAFVILSAVYGLRPAHRSLVCIVSRRLRNAARVVVRLPTESCYCWFWGGSCNCHPSCIRRHSHSVLFLATFLCCALHCDYDTFSEWHCSSRSFVSEIRLNTTCEVLRLAFNNAFFHVYYPAVWCRVFRPCIFDRPAFSSLAFSAPLFAICKSKIPNPIELLSAN